MPPVHRQSDAELVAVTGTRSGEAFAEFYARYERPVLAFFVRRVGNPEVAADLTAETFVRAVESRRRFSPERGAAASWLFGIAGNVLGSSAKRGRVEDAARQRLEHEAVVLTQDTLNAIEALGSDDAASKALEALPKDQRAAIQAHILDGDPYSTVAADLKVSDAVARKRVSRGLATLRSTFGSSR